MSTPSIEPAWSHGESLDRVLDAVRGQVSSLRALSDGSYLTNCVNPAHPDRHPSLHISHITSPHGGRVVFMCYSCGPQSSQDWAQWAGLDYDDLFDDRRWSYHNRSRRRSQDRGPRAVPNSYQRLGPLPKRIAADLHVLLGRPPPARPAAEDDDHQHHYVDVATYTYLDEAGAAFHRVTRQRCTHEGCRAKNFPQSYVKRGGDPAQPGDWVSRKSESGWGADWVSRLFRHQQVADAVADGVPVWVLEGEKDVLTAEGCALVATTNPGGAANFPTHLAQVFAGAAIVNIVIDRDPEGIARAVRIHQMLTQVGVGQVRLWLPATTEASSDFSDHIQAGYAVEDLLAVPLDAALAWDLLDSPRRTGTITKYQAQLQVGADEVDAQLQVAQHERSSGRRAEATHRVSNATRWVKEAAKVYAELVAAAHRVAAHVTKVAAEDPARDWTEQAGQIAQVRVRAARSLLLSLYERAGTSVPPEVDQGQVVLSLAPLPPSQAHAQAQPVGDGSGAGLRLVPGGAGGGDGGATSSVVIEHDHFEVVGGELTQVIWRAGSHGERVKVHRRVVNAPIRLVAKEFAESEEQIDADTLDLAQLGDRDGRDRAEAIRALTSMTHVVVQIPDGHAGWAQVRVPFEDFDSGNFLAHLPISGLSYARGRAGRDKVITAISYISTPELTTAYRATGWRRRADGSYMYVMADGAIDAGGYHALPTNLTGSLANFNLPNPSLDGPRLRAAFLGASAPLVDRLPARIGAVLVGQAFRAALCPNEWVTVLSGSPGSIKTGSAALAMHYFGENWDRMRPASSMTGNGATDNAVRIMAHQAKDAVLFLDDNAPTVSIEQAWRRLESIARMIHNQEGRARATRDGQATLPESRPRTSGLITTELPPRAGASGGRRMFVVPVAKTDIDLHEVIALDTMASRHDRALLMSSYLQWLATDRRGFVLRAQRLRDEWLAQIQRRRDAHPIAVERHGVKVAELWAGWALLLEFLHEQRALTSAEHQQWSTRIQDALLVAAECADDPDLVESTGQRACELLRHALGNGLAYVADATTGGAPHGLERRLGWKGSTLSLAGVAAGGVDWRVGPQAIALGHLAVSPEDEHELELLCERAALEATLKAAASQMADTSSVDLGTVLRALEEEGVLKVRTETRNGNTYTRRTFDRTIRCLPSFGEAAKPVRERRIVLRLAALFGEQDNPEPGGWLAPGPAPSDDPPPTTARADAPAASEASAQQTRPDPPTEPGESSMNHTNAAGLTLRTIVHEDTRACVRCGKRCAMELGGLALHPPCFWATTAASVEQLHAMFPGSGPGGSNGGAPALWPAAAAAPAGMPTAARPAPGPGRQPAAQASSTRPGHQFLAAVAVVDVDKVWLPDGTWRPLTAPISHLGQLEQLGRDLHLGLAPVGWKTYPQPGTIVPTRALWEQLGVPIGQLPKLPSRRGEWLTEVSAGLAALHEAVALGWVFGRGDGDPVLKATTKLRRRDAQRGSVQILMTAGIPEDWGLGEQVGAAQVARRLQLYADTLGIGFSGSPINTGLDLFEATASRPVREALRPVDWSHIPPARQRNLETHFDWTRPPLSHEQDMPWLAFFDRGQSYLATWSSLSVGVGPPEHHDGPVQFNPRQAGWWRITVPDNTIDGNRQHLPYPDLLDPDGTAAGQQRWVTTPALEFAVSHLDVQVDILEAWTWPEERTKRALDGLYKRFRPALAALAAIDDQDARAAEVLVKATYKQLSGYFTSDQAAAAKSAVHQPYWFHAMIAKARVAILRQILTTGQSNELAGRANAWPLVVSNTDMVGYAAASIDPPEAAWPGDPAKLGRGPGAYKPVRYAELAEHAKYLTRRGWSGRDATRRFDDGPPG